MKRGLPFLVTVSIVSINALLPSSAFAAIGFGGVPLSLTKMAASSFEQCNSLIAPAMGQAQLSPTPVPMDKASAILGGRKSRLEEITSQQTGLASRIAPAASGVAGTSAVLSAQSPCSGLILPTVATPYSLKTAPGTDNFLASGRLPIKRTGFDAAWSRVQRQTLPASTVSGLSRITPDKAALAAVNSFANSRIRYVEDKVLYGKADYWAGAKSTWAKGAGDCEDIAIVKLQLLAALGVPRSDMYLTIARDLARNADHAVLVVKLNGQTWMLDNATNEVLDASLSHDYRPIMSFSASGKWLHGYSHIAQRSVIASSNARRTGFNR